MEFDLFDFETKIEDNTAKLKTSRTLKIQEKSRMNYFLKKEKAEQILTELPQPGEAIHVISNGSFDYFNLIPIAIELMGGHVDLFYFSTWTMNNSIVEKILELFDNGKIQKIGCLVGLYMKQREPAVFNLIYEGLKDRNQKVFSNENHSKVTLLQIGENYITIEGSANFTANPRIEQFCIHNDKELYEFHKMWMDEIFI